MKTIIEDDRTPEQKTTHNWAVVARDNSMSGWGGASGGYSRCAWAIPETMVGHIQKVKAWVCKRSEMSFVYITQLSYYRPSRNTAHFHIYVAGSDHPAFA